MAWKGKSEKNQKLGAGGMVPDLGWSRGESGAMLPVTQNSADIAGALQ